MLLMKHLQKGQSGADRKISKLHSFAMMVLEALPQFQSYELLTTMTMKIHIDLAHESQTRYKRKN
jgi:hypothetical protein